VYRAALEYGLPELRKALQHGRSSVGVPVADGRSGDCSVMTDGVTVLFGAMGEFAAVLAAHGVRPSPGRGSAASVRLKGRGRACAVRGVAEGERSLVNPNKRPLAGRQRTAACRIPWSLRRPPRRSHKIPRTFAPAIVAGAVLCQAAGTSGTYSAVVWYYPAKDAAEDEALKLISDTLTVKGAIR
jgi:hypothetical protein